MPEQDLAGRRALVTGGASGIGLACVKEFAGRGAYVIVADFNGDAAQSVAAEVGGEAWVVDLSDTVAQEDLALDVDILVNNAGIIRYGRPEEISLKDWCECIDVDVTGTWLMSKEVVNAYMLAHGGRIVNICSVNSFSAAPTAVVYHVSKAAEAALTKSCAAAWAANGIYVNGIAPGNMQNGEMAPDTPPAILESIRNKVPQRRLGRYGDLSGALLFLASDANTYTQGSIIVCDGGLILEGF